MNWTTLIGITSFLVTEQAWTGSNQNVVFNSGILPICFLAARGGVQSFFPDQLGRGLVRFVFKERKHNGSIAHLQVV